MATLLGTTTDGRTATYDASLYEFYLDGVPASFADMQMLEAGHWLRWRASELRDWFIRIDASALETCNRRARAHRAKSLEAGDIQEARPEGQPRQLRTAQRVDERQAVSSSQWTSRGQVPQQWGALQSRQAPEPLRETAERQTQAAPPQTQAPSEPVVVKLKSAASYSFKSKEGVLSKDRSFEIESCIDAPVSFEKTSGTPYAVVSESGLVDVFKGLPRGVHIVCVRAVPRSQPANVRIVESISVEIKVK